MSPANAVQPARRAYSGILLTTWLLNVFLIIIADRADAQSASAGLTGVVVDSTGAVLPGTTVKVTDQATFGQRQTQSAGDGSFSIPALLPGRYSVIASLSGFKPTEIREVVLNVGDRLELRMELSVSSMGEAVTVISEAQRITTSSAVSTVIDRKFVESLPLNGRSFQALLELAPGVVLTSANTADRGQFSVNGQRTTDNYFMIDGVSANAAASVSTVGVLGTAGSGQLPALTAQGGTNGLVSVDALQEFRLQTSSYAPEYGRVPGGQISLVTRSGTNVIHGTAFEYFRHNALDASDWFLKRGGQEEAKLRQHNFGGVLGGPIRRNHTFAFGSYERLRLLLPQPRNVSVPTSETRHNAIPALRPYLSALPLPNGVDLGNGFGEFLAAYSDPSELDSTSVRIDHNAGDALRFFGRVSNAPSSSETRAESYGFANVVNSNTRSATLGATWLLSKHLVHDSRVSLIATSAPGDAEQRLAGGATLVSPDPFPSGRTSSRAVFTFEVIGGGTARWGRYGNSPTRQFNFVDSVIWTAHSHELKAGVDFRRTITTTRGGGGTELLAFNLDGLRSGRVSQYSTTFLDATDRTVVFDNLSSYIQDHWRIIPRLTLSYGIRWDGIPSPRTTSGPPAVTLERSDDLFEGPIGLAAPGTKLWSTRYNNVAPRAGASYVASNHSSMSLVIKGGIGTFYGLGYGQVANAAGWNYPFVASRSSRDITYPLSPDLLVPPAFGVEPPLQLYVMDHHLELPYTVQWNVSADQGLGGRRSLFVGYLGANGYDLLRLGRYRLRLREWPATQVTVLMSENLGRSDYHALQLQFQERLSRGVQAIISYTWGRSRDTGSSDGSTTVPAEQLPASLDYGYSSFDVRHVLSAALTYQVPQLSGPKVWRLATKDWGVDLMIRARSGFPLDIAASVPFPPATASVRPNIVPGQPFWIDDASAPGGRRLNRQAFAVPPAETQGDLPRGSVRGFGLSQVDLSVRRNVPLTRRVQLQLRIEAFNLFNTPNFADPAGNLAAANFGISTQMLGRGLGGQNALYQVGGPRSVQIASKVLF